MPIPRRVSVLVLLVALAGGGLAPLLAQEPQPEPTPSPADEEPGDGERGGGKGEEGDGKGEEGDEEPKEPTPEDEVKEGIKRERDYVARQRRIQQLGRELQAATLWVQRSILIVELADLEDRRALPTIAQALADEEPYAVAFALRAINGFSADDLRQGGGEVLFDALVEALDHKGSFFQQQTRRALALIVGRDLGKRQSGWKRWKKNNAGKLAKVDPPDGFDESKYDPELVAKVRAETADDATTRVIARIPPVTDKIVEMADLGLEVALCLDQTGSMGAVIEESKKRLATLIAVVEQVIPDSRFGLVTYTDAVAARVPLANARRSARLKNTLNKVRAAGGGDGPEGVDKAVESAFQKDFGWRRDAVKTVVIVGDAPPHAEDEQSLEDLVRQLRDRLEVRFNTVSTGRREVPQLARIAEAGGGRSLTLESPGQLIGEILLLIFGESLRPAMERFVPVLIEILEAGQPKR